MDQPELTSGCLQVLMSGDTYNHHHLVLQVLDKKRFGNNNTRYRLLLSDGAMMTSFVTVGASLNDMSGELTEYTIIQVNSFNIIALNSGRVLNINEFTILKKGEDTNGKIGDPVVLEALLRQQERSIMNLSPPLSQ